MEPLTIYAGVMTYMALMGWIYRIFDQRKDSMLYHKKLDDWMECIFSAFFLMLVYIFFIPGDIAHVKQMKDIFEGKKGDL